MSDYKTRDIVSHILDKMGFRLLAKDAMEGRNLDSLISYIKYKYTGNSEVQEFIEYFL
jgi:hypothetical protein